MSSVFHRRLLKNLTGYSKLRRNRANRGPGESARALVAITGRGPTVAASAISRAPYRWMTLGRLFSERQCWALAANDSPKRVQLCAPPVGARDVGGKRSLEALPDATVKEATHIAVGVCGWIRGGGEPVVDRGRGMIEHVGHARPDRGSAGSGGEHIARKEIPRVVGLDVALIGSVHVAEAAAVEDARCRPTLDEGPD